MARRKALRLAAVTIPLSLMLSACQQSIPKEALQLSAESLQRRQLQTRYYETADETQILAASAAVLQDLGFNLDESETELGVIVGSKERDAMEAGQVVASIAVGVLLGARMPVDKNQKIRASLVTRPSGKDQNRVTVRVTFQRTVWNTDGQVSRIEGLDDPELYQEFFDKLSKSVFLEAHQV